MIRQYSKRILSAFLCETDAGRGASERFYIFISFSPPSLSFIPPLIAPPGRTISPKCFLSSLPFFYREITTVVTHLVLVWNTFTFISSQMRKQPPRRDTHTHTHTLSPSQACVVWRRKMAFCL